MILIADSGSTKTHWVGLEGEKEYRCTTEGLNPLFAGEEVFALACGKVCSEMLPARDARVDEVFFYGAGCGQDVSRQRVRQWLERAIGCEQVLVEGDLLGACRATCGRTEGLVGILGTGSNLCYYDGQVVARQRTSTGYILGDEGSGNHIGKRLLKDYLEERMPIDVSNMFHETYKKEKSDFIDCLYRQPNPNRFLASLVPFAARHREEEYIQEVLTDCFGSFFDQLDYFGDRRNLPLHLVGGITTEFEMELHRMAIQRDVSLGIMIASPIMGLVRFHKG